MGFWEIGPLFVVEGERLARLECVGGWSEDSHGLVAGVALFEDDLHLAAGFGGDEWLLGCEVGGVEVGVLFGGARAGGEEERDGETEQGWWQCVSVHGGAVYHGVGKMLVIFLGVRPAVRNRSDPDVGIGVNFAQGGPFDPDVGIGVNFAQGKRGEV